MVLQPIGWQTFVSCATWPFRRVLEEGPSGYSDLVEAPDGSILCIYERGMLSRMTDSAAVAVARFDRSWLSSGA